jgi:hypothetical protein
MGGAIVLITLLMIGAASSGCGQSGNTHCEDPEAGATIVHRSGGVSCAEALGVESLLGFDGPRRQIVQEPSGNWSCVTSFHQKIIQCRQGRLSFDIRIR